MLKPKTKENENEENELEQENGPRNFYTPTRSGKTNNPQNIDTNIFNRWPIELTLFSFTVAGFNYSGKDLV